jgi:hypothetical protein
MNMLEEQFNIRIFVLCLGHFLVANNVPILNLKRGGGCKFSGANRNETTSTINKPDYM